MILRWGGRVVFGCSCPPLSSLCVFLLFFFFKSVTYKSYNLSLQRGVNCKNLCGINFSLVLGSPYCQFILLHQYEPAEEEKQYKLPVVRHTESANFEKYKLNAVVKCCTCTSGSVFKLHANLSCKIFKAIHTKKITIIQTMRKKIQNIHKNW